jgi:hypothetical protein
MVTECVGANYLFLILIGVHYSACILLSQKNQDYLTVAY